MVSVRTPTRVSASSTNRLFGKIIPKCAASIPMPSLVTTVVIARSQCACKRRSLMKSARSRNRLFLEMLPVAAKAVFGVTTGDTARLLIRMSPTTNCGAGGSHTHQCRFGFTCQPFDGIFVCRCTCPPQWTGYDCQTPVCTIKADRNLILQLQTFDVQRIHDFEEDPCLTGEYLRKWSIAAISCYSRTQSDL